MPAATTFANKTMVSIDDTVAIQTKVKRVSQVQAILRPYYLACRAEWRKKERRRT
jgi:hypothetical protein